MPALFNSLQIILAISLVALILIQAKGTGLGSTFGSNMAVYSTRRGVERIFFRLTIIISILFLVVSIATLVL